jgi:hypothetical protein
MVFQNSFQMPNSNGFASPQFQSQSATQPMAANNGQTFGSTTPQFNATGSNGFVPQSNAFLVPQQGTNGVSSFSTGGASSQPAGQTGMVQMGTTGGAGQAMLNGNLNYTNNTINIFGSVIAGNQAPVNACQSFGTQQPGTQAMSAQQPAYQQQAVQQQTAQQQAAQDQQMNQMMQGFIQVLVPMMQIMSQLVGQMFGGQAAQTGSTGTQSTSADGTASQGTSGASEQGADSSSSTGSAGKASSGGTKPTSADKTPKATPQQKKDRTATWSRNQAGNVAAIQHSKTNQDLVEKAGKATSSAFDKELKALKKKDAKQYHKLYGTKAQIEAERKDRISAARQSKWVDIIEKVRTNYINTGKFDTTPY